MSQTFRITPKNIFYYIPCPRKGELNCRQHSKGHVDMKNNENEWHFKTFLCHKQSHHNWWNENQFLFLSPFLSMGRGWLDIMDQWRKMEMDDRINEERGKSKIIGKIFLCAIDGRLICSVFLDQDFFIFRLSSIG